jgi:Arc/MetJ-type ribon-helix-helix transcriptional regulator
MSRKEYRSLTLPEGLYQELEKFVAHSKGYYVSVAEVVREALRDYLKKQQ